jgi:hypothetical protein
MDLESGRTNSTRHPEHAMHAGAFFVSSISDHLSRSTQGQPGEGSSERQLPGTDL